MDDDPSSSGTYAGTTSVTYLIVDKLGSQVASELRTLFLCVIPPL